jgi:hypothetical protein
MPDCRYLLMLSLALVAMACGEPKCPAGYMKYGDLCRRCPPGEERERGQCVPTWDGSLEAIEDRDPVAPDGADPKDEEQADPHEDASVPPVAPDPQAAGQCYRDGDGDGVGSGEPVDCSEAMDGLVPNNTDCDDEDPARSPNLTDVCGDVIDNDCDGTIDDEANNACGGDCSAQLGHQPGEACNNGLRGACLRTGTYACQGSTVTVCNAPSATGSAELCDDGVDNDCDGTVDEADAANAPTWFQDCDGDGYSASTVGSVVACKRPTSQTSCVAWTERSPTVEAPDCDDSSAAYHPGAVFSFRPTGKTSFDLDCNGAVTKEPFLRSNNTILPLPVTRICSSPSDCDNCMREFLLNYPIDCTTGHGGTDVTNGEANWVVHHTRGSDGRCYANQDYARTCTASEPVNDWSEHEPCLEIMLSARCCSQLWHSRVPIRRVPSDT